MPVQAALWGLLAGSGLLLGAAIAVVFYDQLSHRIIAASTGFGGGVLIAMMSVDLMQKSFDAGSAVSTIVGFLAGATIFSAVNWLLAQHGARHRNRCGGCVAQPSEAEHKGSGLAIAVGALLDGIPESMVIGLSLVGGGHAGWALVAGFFLSNVPQGLSSASGMKTAGRSRLYIFSVWATIPVLSGLASMGGYVGFGLAAPSLPAGIMAFAAGAVIAMLAESMIPEAFEDAQPFIGLVTAAGFISAFLLVQ